MLADGVLACPSERLCGTLPHLTSHPYHVLDVQCLGHIIQLPVALGINHLLIYDWDDCMCSCPAKL